jgi:hypothetical protein
MVILQGCPFHETESALVELRGDTETVYDFEEDFLFSLKQAERGKTKQGWHKNSLVFSFMVMLHKLVFLSIHTSYIACTWSNCIKRSCLDMKGDPESA